MKIKKKTLILMLIPFAVVVNGTAHAFSWAPINPDELKMTSEPKAPGAPAIILEQLVDRDDSEYQVSTYVRIKVLTEEGRKYGDVEIRYDKNSEHIWDIRARTIRPDGKIIDFDGKIFDKLIIKAGGLKYQAKTFALPEVQIGSIVEYHFIDELPPHWVYDSRWVLSDELFIKHAKYTLTPNGSFSMRSTWPRGLPPGVPEPAKKNGQIRLETHDVPAFIIEDYMPPEVELKYHVDFVYSYREISETDPVKYWQKFAKLAYHDADNFMDERKAMERIVSGLIQPGDSDEDRLRKVYAHVQKLRNLTYEKDKTAQEQKRDKTRDRSTVADVEKYGYGTATDLTYLFVALARAAGFKADFALAATRNQYFFQPGAMNPNQLTSNIAVVSVAGKEMYFEPGVPFIPFGMVPWYESAVLGLRLDKQEGTWLKIPLTTPAQSKTTRKATLKLEDGELAGTVVVTYTGLDAIDQRLEELYDDEAARKEYIEDELKRAIPVGSEVTLTNSPDWTGAETPLVVEYKVKVAGWVVQAGKRLLMPVGLFGASAQHIFEHEQRVQPIYFHYPNVSEDEINIELPPGLQLTSAPKSRDENVAVATFSSSTGMVGSTIQIKRQLDINAVIVQEKYYLALRDFFKAVRTNDEEQIIVAPVAASTSAAKADAMKH